MENLKKSAQDLLKDLTNETEQGFLNELNRHHAATVGIERDKIVSDFYLAKKAEQVTRDLITSNEHLSESSRKQSGALIIFTAGICIVGIIQLIFALIN